MIDGGYMKEKYEIKKLTLEGRQKFVDFNNHFDSFTPNERQTQIDGILSCSESIKGHEGFYLEDRNFKSKKEMFEYLYDIKDKNGTIIDFVILNDPDVITFITLYYHSQTILKQGLQLNRYLAGALSEAGLLISGKNKNMLKKRADFVNYLKDEYYNQSENTEILTLLNNYDNKNSRWEKIDKYIQIEINKEQISEEKFTRFFDECNELQEEINSLREPGSFERHILLSQMNIYNRFGEWAIPLVNTGVGDFSDIHEQCTANSKTRHSTAYFKCVYNIYTKDNDAGERIFVSNASGKHPGNLRIFNLEVNTVGSQYDIHEMSDENLIKKINNSSLTDLVNWMKKNNPENVDYLLDIIGD